MTNIVLGVDIGGTYTKFGLVDIDGNVFHESNIRTDIYDDFEKFVNAIKEKVFHSYDHNKFNLQGIGIGAPNGNFFSGSIEFAPNLNWKGIVPVSEIFEKHFSTKTLLTNDANAAAMGEKIYGNATGLNDFIMITLGTGVGSGIVANGKLIYGHDGLAGEVGHINVFPEGRLCGCGKKGCLETYASVTGLRKTVIELLENSDKNSILNGFSFEDLDGEKIHKAACEGDKLALEAFDYTAKILGLKLADCVAFSSPETIFIFGGLAQAGDLLFVPLRKYFEESLLPVYKNKTDIRPSGLQCKNIAVLGAAALIWNELKDQG